MLNKGIIVGLGAKKGGGKDTVADYLVENYGFEKLSYADTLKRACSEAFGFPIEWAYDYDEKEKSRGNRYILTQDAIDVIKKHFNIHDDFEFKVVTNCWFDSIREILQKIGTDYLRNQYDKDIHIKATFDGIDSNKRYVVADVRFPNELAIMKEKDYPTIYLNRKTLDSGDVHESENAVSAKDFKYYIDNNGTIDDLYYKIKTVLAL